MPITQQDSLQKVIRDFLDSHDPKFEGKTPEERIEMANAAYYAMHKNESTVISFKEFLVENNKGDDYERDVVDKLDKQGILTGGKEKSAHKKADAEVNWNGSKHGIEIKSDVKKDYGQIALQYHPEKGWHISDRSRRKAPMLANHMERSGILDRINASKEWHRYGRGEEGAEPEDINHKVEGTDAIRDYHDNDKDSGYIHIQHHGMYHFGTDDAGLGTPKFNEDGKVSSILRARIKSSTAGKRDPETGLKKTYRQANVSLKLANPNDLKKSNLSLDADLKESVSPFKGASYV